MGEACDLLGDPIPANWGKRGRPAHIPTDRNRNKIRVLLGLGWAVGRIAAGLRITRDTLRKHYVAELRASEEARPALEAAHAMKVYECAMAGNVGALKELGKLLNLAELARPQPAEEADEPLGKRARADAAAGTAHEGTGWAELLH